jgi:predicted transcriptional regulator of viral defense system
MLDLASDQRVSGGLHNVATVIVELAEEGVDVVELVRAAAAFPAAAGRRVGHLLDTYAGVTPLDALATAVASRETSPSCLDPTAPATGALDRRWHLHINRPLEVEA